VRSSSRNSTSSRTLALQPLDTSPPRLILVPAVRRWLTVLSVVLGFGQGCGLCFTVGSGGFYGKRFNNPMFLIYLCAFFFLPPVVVTVLSVLFDASCNIKTGVRIALKFRIYVSSVGVILCLFLLCLSSGPTKAYAFEGVLVLTLAVAIGLFGAVLLSSSSALLGTADAGLVPCIILGQTAAGVYTNVVADVIGFEPHCPPEVVQAYWSIAGGTLLAVLCVFVHADLLGFLEMLWRYHEALLETMVLNSPRGLARRDRESRISSVPGVAPQRPSAAACSQGYNPVQRRLALLTEMGRSRLNCCTSATREEQGEARVQFGWTCWSMALCQAVAIAFNMSLTPLSNQMAHGDYDLTQTIVLVKLMSDFAGRILFFVLPRPDVSQSAVGTIRSIQVQTLLVWLVAAYRAPLWFCQFYNARQPLGGEGWTRFLDNEIVRLWVIWLPMVSTGAMSSSWCIVIALNSVSEELRNTVNLLMTASIYLGYFVGIAIALISS